MPIDADKFPARLRLARKHSHLTMNELARRVGLATRQAYQAYESGRVLPRIDLCERLADALGVRRDWLAGWSD
jgi:transcriptional regulator with XRE-family HTH domain